MEEVVGLHVAVNDAVGMHVRQRLKQGAHVPAYRVNPHCVVVLRETTMLEVRQHERAGLSALGRQISHRTVQRHHIVLSIQYDQLLDFVLPSRWMCGHYQPLQGHCLVRSEVDAFVHCAERARPDGSLHDELPTKLWEVERFHILIFFLFGRQPIITLFHQLRSLTWRQGQAQAPQPFKPATRWTCQPPKVALKAGFLGGSWVNWIDQETTLPAKMALAPPPRTKRRPKKSGSLGSLNVDADTTKEPRLDDNSSSDSDGGALNPFPEIPAFHGKSQEDDTVDFLGVSGGTTELADNPIFVPSPLPSPRPGDEKKDDAGGKAAVQTTCDCGATLTNAMHVCVSLRRTLCV